MSYRPPASAQVIKGAVLLSSGSSPVRSLVLCSIAGIPVTLLLHYFLLWMKRGLKSSELPIQILFVAIRSFMQTKPAKLEGDSHIRLRVERRIVMPRFAKYKIYVHLTGKPSRDPKEDGGEQRESHNSHPHTLKAKGQEDSRGLQLTRKKDKVNSFD